MLLPDDNPQKGSRLRKNIQLQSQWTILGLKLPGRLPTITTEQTHTVHYYLVSASVWSPDTAIEYSVLDGAISTTCSTQRDGIMKWNNSIRYTIKHWRPIQPDPRDRFHATCNHIALYLHRRRRVCPRWKIHYNIFSYLTDERGRHHCACPPIKSPVRPNATPGVIRCCCCMSLQNRIRVTKNCVKF